MRITAGQFSRFLLLLGLTAFLWAVFFGASHSAMAMEQYNDGTQMGSCLFDGTAKPCTMSFSQHLSSWQGLFTAVTPEKATALVLLALLAVIFAAALALHRYFTLPLKHVAYRWKLYIRQRSLLVIFNPLREVFSQGILNPKLY